MKLGQKAQEKQSSPNHKVFPWQKKLFKAQVLGLSFKGLFECELALTVALQGESILKGDGGIQLEESPSHHSSPALICT